MGDLSMLNFLQGTKLHYEIRRVQVLPLPLWMA